MALALSQVDTALPFATLPRVERPRRHGSARLGPLAPAESLRLRRYRAGTQAAISGVLALGAALVIFGALELSGSMQATDSTSRTTADPDHALDAARDRWPAVPEVTIAEDHRTSAPIAAPAEPTPAADLPPPVASAVVQPIAPVVPPAPAPAQAATPKAERAADRKPVLAASVVPSPPHHRPAHSLSAGAHPHSVPAARPAETPRAASGGSLSGARASTAQAWHLPRALAPLDP